MTPKTIDYIIHRFTFILFIRLIKKKSFIPNYKNKYFLIIAATADLFSLP